ncbi:MazG-like pyrophosphatase [Mycobacterium phage Phlei]|uniref:NTP pyrophosphohydrolase MazG-like domain-containing protein n=1 Tax=Mycobacterium phage Phlei TaxID=1690684 RepID=A0A0N9BDR4_9CAUD|nr:MazG-like pyrophosphatase [Mycobacterium phage Phlei]ALA48166.1 hypothetical protein [Mycobacterium phage Phlei]
MNMLEYQLRAADTAIYPGVGDRTSIEGLSYVTMGLVGEAGEIANKVKKIIRDGGSRISIDDKQRIAAELGDVLWYLAASASQIGYSLAEIATYNLQKLEDRKERGVLQGSGDDR